jgi:hypothetical protein
MAMATSATTMSHVGKKAGTLVIVVMKAVLLLRLLFAISAD